MLQEPTSKPTCCGKTSKWVYISDRLHYFFCNDCKKEVTENIDDYAPWFLGGNSAEAKLLDLSSYVVLPPAYGRSATNITKIMPSPQFSGGLTAPHPGILPLDYKETRNSKKGTGDLCRIDANGAVHCWSSIGDYHNKKPCNCGRRYLK